MIFEGEKLTCQKIEGDIAELHFNAKTDSVNKFDKITLEELNTAILKIKEDRSIRGVLLTSGKSVFIVGADITEFLTYFKLSDEELIDWTAQANRTFSMLEDLDIPTVTAINGIALGGGLEIALTTSYRVMATTAKVGLPEVKLGIFPGFGGTVRLSRLVGADNAIEWIAMGNENRADSALKTGVVDAVVEVDQVRAVSIRLLQRAIAGELDWKSRQAEKKAPLHLNEIESTMVFEGARQFIGAQAGPNYPAPLTALGVMQAGARLERDDALEIEHEGFVEVAKSDTATSLINLFMGDQYLKREAKKYQKIASPIKTAAVLGAGIMGGGIAYQSASKGMPIVMKDIAESALELGLTEATKLLDKRVSKGKMTATKMAGVLNSIRPTLSYGDMGNVDIIVEAVVEKTNVKQAVLGEVEGLIREDTILTSNTSTISITTLAEKLKRPENFCGMHFFNPVHRMPLVEVIRGEKSSEQAIATTVAYASAMGKTPIVVNDCPGFLVNRILFPYFAGFSGLVANGVDFKRIDKVMTKFGWPMGPAHLLDVVGIDTANHAGQVMAAGFPDRMSPSGKTPTDLMFENERYGQKNNKGFYRYQLDKKGRQKKELDPSVDELLTSLITDPKEVSDTEIIERMMIPMIIESSLCLEDKIVNSPAEVDMGLIYGLGFPPFRGGALLYADSLGISKVCDLADQYTHLGAIYQPSAQMKELASTNSTFYSL